MSRIHRAASAVVVCGLFLPCVHAHAQSQSILSLLPTEGRTLTVDEEAAGGLSFADPFGPDGERMEAWSLEGTAGQSVTIDLHSEAFDPVIFVAGPGLQSNVRDDDSGPGCDARVELTFLETGTHTVVAASTFADQTGAYTLHVQSTPRPIAEYACGAANPEVLQNLPVDPERTLEVGESAVGFLDGDEPQIDDNRRGVAWTLEGTQGGRVTVRLVSEAFDPYLYAVGPGLDVITDDDSGGDRNAQLELTFPGTGRYRIIVSSFGGGAEGGYTIEVAPPLDANDVAPAGSLVLGETVEGTLPTSAPTLFDGRPAQIWELDGQAGQSVSVELLSDDFDPYLYLIGPGLDTPMEDDDGAGGLNARIDLALPESGSYRVVVSAFGSGSGGDFELTASAGP